MQPNDTNSTRLFRAQLGKTIRTLRNEQHLSLRKFGLMIGVDYTYLFDIEHGKANASVDVLVKIASGLNVEVWELFYGARDSRDAC